MLVLQVNLSQLVLKSTLELFCLHVILYFVLLFNSFLKNNNVYFKFCSRIAVSFYKNAVGRSGVVSTESIFARATVHIIVIEFNMSAKWINTLYLIINATNCDLIKKMRNESYFSWAGFRLIKIIHLKITYLFLYIIVDKKTTCQKHFEICVQCLLKTFSCEVHWKVFFLNTKSYKLLWRPKKLRNNLHC